MRFAALLMVIIVLAFPALSQEADRDDRGFLQGLLEDNLSDAGREVRIEGFEGALSSRATIEKLTIADGTGIWLTLNDVVLDWSRKALLDGRLEVNELKAGEILLPRLPVTGTQPEADKAPAQPFALPELPVAVNIAKLAAGKVVIGEPVFGQAAELSLEAALKLEGGEGSTVLAVTRTDRPGALTLDASYANATGILALDMELTEGPEGIAATLLQLPGRPAVELAVKGTAPLSEYRADIRLATNGAPRVTGSVTLAAEGTPEAPSRRFAASLAGDISPLFVPELRPFFGDSARFDLSGRTAADGSVTLDEFALRTAELDLAGSLDLAPGGMPRRFALAGRIGGKGAVRLPLPGPATWVDSALIEASFDAEKGEQWQADLRLSRLRRAEITLQQARLTGTGTIHSEAPQAVTAELQFVLEGFSHADPALTQALGRALGGATTLSWQAGGPLRLEAFRATGEGLQLQAQGTLDLQAEGLPAEGRAEIRAKDIARFAPLSGRDIAGQIEAAVEGRAELRGDGFDLSAQLSGTGVRSGITELDRVMGGEVTLDTALWREGGRLGLRHLRLETPSLTVSAEGETAGGAIDFTAELTDLALLVPEFSGPVQAEGRAEPAADDWRIALEATGPGGTSAAIEGLVAGDGSSLDLSLAGSAPLGMANPFIAPRRIEGTASYDLRLQGAPSLSALSGRVSASGARLSAPKFNVAMEGIDATVDIASGRAQIDLNGQVRGGGTVSVSGPVALTAPYEGDLSVLFQRVRLQDPELYDTSVDGRIALSGPLAGAGLISGAVTLGETELRIPSGGMGEIGNLPGLRHVNDPAAVRATRARAGLLEGDGAGGGGPAMNLDLTIDAPSRIFVRGRGLDAELGGRLQLSGTTDNVVPSGLFELIRGRLDILGKRLEMTEGRVDLQGAFDPYLYFVASTRADEVDIRILVEGLASDPQITFTSQPELPQEEVVSRLIFGRGLENISPFQAARLAAAVATLAGRGGEGVVGKLRSGFGLSDLDVTTTEAGATEVRAGAYLSENIYSDVTVDNEGQTEIDLNLDLTPSTTLRGKMNSIGETSLGIFYERDY